MSDFPPITDILLGKKTLIVGVEEEKNGDLRVYFNARWKGIYAIVPAKNTDVILRLRRAWDSGQKVFTDPPPPEMLWSTKERP